MPRPFRLLVSGASGRMGRALGRLAARGEQIHLVGGLVRDAGEHEPGEFPAMVDLGDAAALIQAADVIVDFSAPEYLGALLERHHDAIGRRALVTGTTGLGEREASLLAARATIGPVLTAANFSIGVNVLLSLVRQVSSALPGFDVEIVEAHHRRKEDSPSGTALALGEAVAAGRAVELQRVRRDGRSGRPGARPATEIGFHAVRGGDVIGDHNVLFLGDMERVEIAHRATDRDVFVAGALRAAEWLVDREPGEYSMRDVLGLA